MNQNVTKPGTSQKIGLIPASYLLDRYQSTTIYELPKIDNPNGCRIIVAPNLLKILKQEGKLPCISGLNIGKIWSVYTVSGELIYLSVASREIEDISLTTREMYIIQSENKIV